MDESSRKKRKRDDESSRKKKKREMNRRIVTNPHADVFFRNTFNSIIPKKQHQTRCKRLIEKVRNVLTAKFKGSEVYIYGSYASGTALAGSDIDFGLKFKTRSALDTIRGVANILEDNGVSEIELRSIEMRVHGREGTVFFLNGLDGESGIDVDLSLNNQLAPFASTFVRAVVDHHLTEKMLLVLIKHFATCHEINDITEGGLCNIGHSYLGIHVLHKNNAIPQFLKKEQITSIDELVQESNSFNIASQNFIKPLGITTVASLLQDYFKFYSEDVDFVKMAISIRGGCLVTKRSFGWPKKEKGYYLAIVDPFSGENAGNNVTEHGLEKIIKVFKGARRILEDGGELETLFQPFDSSSSSSSSSS